MLVTLEWSTQMTSVPQERMQSDWVVILPLLRQMQENTQKQVTVCNLFVSTIANRHRNMCKNQYEKVVLHRKSHVWKSAA